MRVGGRLELVLGSLVATSKEKLSANERAARDEPNESTDAITEKVYNSTCMLMHTFVCVCVCVCVCARVHRRMRLHVLFGLHVAHAHTHAYTRTCIHLYVQIYHVLVVI